MGTAKDWIEVLLSGGFLGGAMLLLHVFDRKTSKLKPALSVWGVLFYVSAGLLYGLLVRFGWQAFRWPLVLVTVLALAGGALVGWLYRRSLPPRPTPEL
jgi:hypothetical protein